MEAGIKTNEDGDRYGARGWRHATWRHAYYPQDLPDEWQLAYYSNEFSVVLVPAADWRAQSPETLGQWVEDVHEEFRFFLELPALAASRAGCEAQLNEYAPLFRSFGTQLGGVLLTADCVDSLPVRLAALQAHRASYNTVYVLFNDTKDAVAQLANLRDYGALLACPLPLPAYDAEVGELLRRQAARLYVMENPRGALSARQLRGILEQAHANLPPGGDVTLFVDGDAPDIETLRTLRTLAELMFP
jgi:hypothetical protein